MVIVKDLLIKGTEILSQAIENPRFEAEYILSDILKTDRIMLSVKKDMQISQSDENTFISFCKRRSAGEPTAYILGHKEFMSLDFCVNPHVLIPRPETELLAEEIINRHNGNPHKIIDICTGSGAIACSLAYYMPDSELCAIDISREALETAKLNSEKILKNKKIEFFCKDALKKFSLNKKFDIAVSNPPYIESEIIETLDTEVRNHEPRLALDGGYDGLIFYTSIVHNIESILEPNGFVYFEIGYNQGKAVKHIMQKKFKNIEIIKDLAGLDRIVTGQLA